MLWLSVALNSTPWAPCCRPLQGAIKIMKHEKVKNVKRWTWCDVTKKSAWLCLAASFSQRIHAPCIGLRWLEDTERLCWSTLLEIQRSLQSLQCAVTDPTDLRIYCCQLPDLEQPREQTKSQSISVVSKEHIKGTNTLLFYSGGIMRQRHYQKQPRHPKHEAVLQDTSH